MYICGQKNILSKIDYLISRDSFPRFSIIVANSGFGKKVISDYIARKLNANFVPCELKVGSIREIISNCYTVTEKTLYMFADCDDMSVSAKNSLLKVTEEPPNDSYFIMTVKDVSNVLGTILSRGTTFYLDNYSSVDLLDYIDYKKISFTDKQMEIVKEICTCPEDVNILSSQDIEQMYDVANKFISFIGSANISNELKISTLLSTKKDDGKINPILFMRCIMLCCNNNILQDCTKEDLNIYNTIIRNTSRFLYDLQYKAYNNQMTLDNWILQTHMDITGGSI